MCGGDMRNSASAGAILRTMQHVRSMCSRGACCVSSCECLLTERPRQIETEEQTVHQLKVGEVKQRARCCCKRTRAAGASGVHGAGSPARSYNPPHAALAFVTSRSVPDVSLPDPSPSRPVPSRLDPPHALAFVPSRPVYVSRLAVALPLAKSSLSAPPLLALALRSGAGPLVTQLRQA